MTTINELSKTTVLESADILPVWKKEIGDTRGATFGTVVDAVVASLPPLSGSGTVTSVALSVPTGLTVSGSPVTSSGTIVLSYTAGYSIPSDASQSNWNTAYGWGNHALAGYNLRSNHTGTQLASTISDFDSSARAQIEGALAAGANITITPSGSGATRTFTIAAAGGAGATNLSYTAATRVIASDTGTDATLPLVTSSDAGLAPASGGGTTNFLRADGTWAAPPGGGGSSDHGALTGLADDDHTQYHTDARGDARYVQLTGFDAAVAATPAVTANTAKVTNATHTGEVTGATALTIAAGVVTNAKLANVSTATIKGRATAGTGSPEDLTAAQVRTLINVADGATANSSDATLLNRANHTGTQAQSTVTNLTTDLAAKAPLASPTFTGTVTLPAGQVVNGMTLSTAAGSSVFLSGDGTYTTPAGGGGSSDHGTLTGLGDDDHTQYHTDARGDARYTAIAHTGAGGTAYANATTSVAGFMSAADKTKLDGVAAGAEVNVNADWNAVSGDAQILNKPTLGTAAAAATTDFAAASHVGSGGASHAAATTSVAGFMSASDKTKLDSVASGATAVTNSDIRAQVEAELIAGTNVTITPGGSGATRTLTIAASGGGGGALDDLSDVTITTPTTGQVLKYNGTAWVNDTDATSAGGAIDAANIADGTVSNAEFQYLNGVTSAIQTQLDGKLLAADAAAVTATKATPVGSDRLFLLDSADSDLPKLMNFSSVASASDLTSLTSRVNTISNFASPNAGGVVVGQFYDNSFQGTASSTLAGVANRIDLAPYYTSIALPIDQIGVAVSTAVAGALGKIVIYGDDGSGWPGPLLYESGDISFATVAYAFASLTFTFTRGTIYWVGVRHSSTATLRTINVSSAVNLGLTSSTASNYATVLRRTVTFATAAPDPWVFTNTDRTANITPPSIRFRAA